VEPPCRRWTTTRDEEFADYERTRLDLSQTLFDATDETASFTGSDARLQTLHRMLSREMAREVRALADEPVAAAR